VEAAVREKFRSDGAGARGAPVGARLIDLVWAWAGDLLLDREGVAVGILEPGDAAFAELVDSLVSAFSVGSS
jgi:hypothetical protein